MRAPGFFSVLLVAALIAALPTAATGQAAGGGPAANPWFAAPSFDARGGFEQLFVTDADPGSALTASIAGTSEVDDLGSVMFRDLSPGHYIVATSGTVNWGVEVGSAEGSTPEHSFYDDQEINEGFTYVETRDGTTLSAYVVLPGPVEDGPYPTVVEYSGYNPSDPFSGLGGGFDATPLCGSLPTLCKAPAQPGSQLAGLFGYATVGVNVRGTGCSGGAYDFFETMQVLDGFDVIEAVAAQPWVKDHEVGMVGLSYPGISQLFVAQSNPPSLGAITPLSVYGDTAILAPGGLLNTGFATSWADQVLRNAESYGTGWVRRAIDEGDAQCDANQQLRGQNVDATAKARSQPFCTDEVAAPLDTREFAGDIEAAVFLTSAFQDEQTGPSFGDLLGEFDSAESVKQIIFNGLHADGFAPQILSECSAFLDLCISKEIPENDPILDIVTSAFTGDIFGGAVSMPPSRWIDVSTHAEALARWENEDLIRILMDNGAGAYPYLPVAAWEMSTTTWPPTGVDAERWYFLADGQLVDKGSDTPDTGVAIHPNPEVSQTHWWTGGNIWSNPTVEWIPQAEGENARFQTAPLRNDMVMARTGSVDLWLRSDSDNAELEVLLTEIRPDGEEVRVQAGQLEWAYRRLDNSSTELQPVQCGREELFTLLEPGVWSYGRIQIPAFAHTFREGSSIRMAVNTPGGDTARWEFELDGPGAEATHVIGTGGDHQSSIALPVISGMEAPMPLPACNSLRGQPCRTAPPIENVVVDADFCSLLTCPIPETLNDERPSEFVLPSDYDPAKEYPLVVVLHGFGANGPIQSLYMGVSPAVDDRDFILVHPNGTELPSGTKFWYSGASCCGFPVDDVSYITGLINDAKGAFNVNDYQVYLWGHSNGGFMSFTMACEASSSITAIASLAGSSFVDAGDCGPSDEPVSVLQIHGTDDGIISYDDSAFSPGAEAMFERTAGFLGCDLGSLTVGPTLDIVGNLDGEETTARACNDGCIGDTSAELWTIEDGPHIPSFNTNFAENVLDWLFSKSR
jgi:predicted acyl esterase/poly(3-hydroxybutyrate) depolymerase